MIKTPEELTAEWKLNKKRNGYFYYQDVNKDIYVSQWYKLNPAICVKVLAPVPPYDEYKAMQEQLNKEGTWYTEISYKKLKKELESARWYQTVQNEDIGKLRRLLKECLPIVSAEIMTWQIRGGEESYKRGQDLLTRINATLGESEEK